MYVYLLRNVMYSCQEKCDTILIAAVHPDRTLLVDLFSYVIQNSQHSLCNECKININDPTYIYGANSEVNMPTCQADISRMN